MLSSLYNNSLFILSLHSSQQQVSFQLPSNLKEFLFRINQYSCLHIFIKLLSLTSLAFFNLKYIATTAFHRLLDIIFHTILDFLTKDCYLKQFQSFRFQSLKIAIKFIFRHFCWFVLKIPNRLTKGDIWRISLRSK